MNATSTRPDYAFLGKSNSLHFKIKWGKVHNFSHIGHEDEGSPFWSGSVFQHFTLPRPDWLCSSCFQNMWGSGCVWQMDLQEHHDWQFFVHVLAKKKWNARMSTAAEDLTDHCAGNFSAMLMEFLDLNSLAKIPDVFQLYFRKSISEKVIFLGTLVVSEGMQWFRNSVCLIICKTSCFSC